jgi:hypothetical protein
MKQVVYRESVLSKGSTALELWELWQREKSDRNAAQKKLDTHMKEVEARHRDVMERYTSLEKPSGETKK